MRTNKITKRTALQANVPSVAEIQNELATAESIDDFFGKEGISGALLGAALCGYT